MKIELRELMNENEMLSHIFLGCIKREKLEQIRDKYIGQTDGESKDWQKESVKLPVEIKIGGVDVNPKEFFDSWKDQMQRIILEEAKNLVSKQLGSSKIRMLTDNIYRFEEVLKHWESEIYLDVENPCVESK